VPRPVWLWDECIQRGTDYTTLAEVRTYDERMAALRDVAAEADDILSVLDLCEKDVLLEVGTGTGAFARAAARRCHKVIAIDVSPVMLAYAAEKAREQQISNVDFVEAGFLTYEHQGEPVAAVVSQLALHHLPDAWKVIALGRLRRLMREGGRLYIRDVVYADCTGEDWRDYFQRLVDSGSEDRQEEMASHIREEFSTFDWMMREIITRAGFILERAHLEGDFLAGYLCRCT